MICKISYRIDIILIFSKDMYLWKYKIAINELNIWFNKIYFFSIYLNNYKSIILFINRFKLFLTKFNKKIFLNKVFKNEINL